MLRSVLRAGSVGARKAAAARVGGPLAAYAPRRFFGGGGGNVVPHLPFSELLDDKVSIQDEVLSMSVEELMIHWNLNREQAEDLYKKIGTGDMEHHEHVEAEEISIHFIQQDLKRVALKAKVGETLFEVMQRAKLPVAFNLSCGAAGGVKERDEFAWGPDCTVCHVFISSDYLHLLQPTSLEERICFDSIPDGDQVKSTSRLSCQIVLKKEMDGMGVALTTYRSYASGDPYTTF